MLTLRTTAASLLAAIVLLTGCTTPLPRIDGAKYGPFFTPQNYQAMESMPNDVRRVAILPLADDGSHQEESLTPLDAAAVKALSMVARFETIRISRDDCGRLTHSRSIQSVDVLPYDFLERIASETGADAVLFLDLTHYSAYSPIEIGLRAKLIRISDRAVVWAIDQTFSTANAAVTNSARRYWIKSAPPDTPVDISTTVLLNPSRFGDYVFFASFETLPPRKAPAN